MKAQSRRSINTAVSTPQYAPDRFVNREEEKNLVMGKVEDLIAGRPVEKRAITFTGGRGTGKTWLLAHLKTLLSELTGVIVLHLNLKDYGGKDPSSAVAQIIREVNRATGGSDRTLGVELAEMSRRLMARLEKDVLSTKVLVLLLDHAHESDWELLSVLEDYLLGPLITMPRVLIVMTGRGWLYPWKTPELRLKGEFVDLKTFCKEDTEAQVERQVPKPRTTSEKVHQLSDGNPLANYLIAYYGVPEGLNEVIEGLLEPVSPEHRRKVRDYLEALCVLRAFDEERIPTMLAVYYGDDSYRDWTFAQARKVRQELTRWAFARWDAERGGYVLDETTRKLVEEYLKTSNEKKWRALQQAASELYRKWAEDFPRTKGRWQEEARYHISFLKRASPATTSA